MDCPSCGAYNSDSAPYCSLCFKPLGAEAAPTATPGAGFATPGPGPGPGFAPSPPSIPQPQAPAYGAPAPSQPQAPTYGAPSPSPGYESPVAPLPWAASMPTQPVQPTAPGAGPAQTPAPVFSGTAPAVSPGSPMLSPNEADLESNAMEYLLAHGGSGSLVPEPPKPSSPSIDPRIIGAFARYGIIPALLLLMFIGWVVTGGLSAANKGKLAQLYVPPGTTIVANIAEIEEGPLGHLSADRRELYGTRVFVAPMTPEAALAYYTTGPGQAALAKDGWKGPTRKEQLFGYYWQFTREVPISPTARAEQNIHLVIDDDPRIVDDAGKEVMAKVVAGKTTAIRLGATGASLEKVEWKNL